MLVGLLIEPVVNYFDTWVLRPTLGKLIKRKDKHEREEAILVAEIREKYLGDLGSKVKNPFHICKDYVEAKSLSTTFMIFLARYGFYRNCALIAVAVGSYGAWILTSAVGKVCIAALALLAAYVFKRRAEDFYSYLAPAVYRAFLIDKVKWVQ